MAHDLTELRKRFLKIANKKWYCYNTYDRNYKDLSNKSGVYFFVRFNSGTKEADIVYIGSSVNLKERYRGHNIPAKIKQCQNCFHIFFFKEMDKRFYDYEIKLIKKLKPEYNYQHTHRRINA